MELMAFLRVLLRRWWLVAIPLVIVAVLVIPDFLSNRGAVSGGYTVSVRYSAAQVLEAIPGRDGDFQDVWLASELTVNAMTDWVRTSSFLKLIVDEAQAKGATIDAAGVGVAADNKRSVGVLYLSYSDEAGLQALTDAALDVLKTQAQNYFPQLGGQPAQVTILDNPTITPAPPALANRFAPLIRVGIALLAGIGLAFLVEYLDPTLRRKEQLEAMGINVIATLPRK